MASVVYVTNKATGLPIDDSDRLSKIRLLLRHVLKGGKDKRSAQTVVSLGGTHTERRLHQMMYADRDYDNEDVGIVQDMRNDGSMPLVTVEHCVDKGYTVVNVRCFDRPKLLFDTVCTLTDMHYVSFFSGVLHQIWMLSSEF